MQRAILILVAMFAVGCVMDNAAPVDAPSSGVTFIQDIHYTGIVPPYATPEDCEATNPNPIECHLELGFCANGVAAFSNYDLPEQGSYHLEGKIVVATLQPSSGPAYMFQLDTQTGQATNLDASSFILDTVGRWQTLQFDTGTVCPD